MRPDREQLLEDVLDIVIGVIFILVVGAVILFFLAATAGFWVNPDLF